MPPRQDVGSHRLSRRAALAAMGQSVLAATAAAQVRYPLPYPPRLPGGKQSVTATTEQFLRPGPNLRDGVQVARTPPTVDFLYYPGQNYPGNPWCHRADGCVVGTRYYSALCDHLAPKGTAILFEYDWTTKQFRELVNTAEFLRKVGQIPPEMNYSPGEVQTRIDLGSDGWLYYGTTRGSTRVTTDANGFRGDWVLRTHPDSGKTEVVAAFPVPKHCIPAGVLDPQRLIFYGGTVAGSDAEKQGVQFFAWDVRRGRLLKTADRGFDRYAIFSHTTGRVYWEGHGYDPQTNQITPSEAPHVRSATRETPQGLVYGTSHRSADVWAFDVRRQKVSALGSGAVGTQEYVASIDADPSGRYLYYIPGAHGGATRDGTPIVQFDTRTKTRKVLAFLHEYFWNQYDYALDGCFGAALDAQGARLFISWDGWRRGQPRGWESSVLTVLHIPESERPAA